MSEMLEKAARALAEHLHGEPEPWTMRGDESRPADADLEHFVVDGVMDLRAAVRVVLQAIREPTDSMADAGSKYLSHSVNEPIGAGFAEGAWQAMIDKILKGDA